MKNSFVSKLESIIDTGKPTDHQTLVDQVAHLFENPEKISSKLNPDVVDSCYPPVVQSGGEYDLSWAPQSSSGEIHAGTIILGLAARYKSYCSMIARTYLIDPTTAMQSNYTFLLTLYQKALDLLHPGTECKHIYNTLLAFIKESDKHKHLAEHFLEDCGAGIGLELVEKEYILNSKNNNKLRKNMVVTLRLGFKDLEASGVKEAKKKHYALYICDTILLTDEGAAEMTNVKKGTNDVFYFLDEDEDDEADKKPKKDKPAAKDEKGKKGDAPKVKKEKKRDDSDDESEDYAQVEKRAARDRAEEALLARDRVLRNKNVQTTAAAQAEMRRKEHQRALAQKQKEEAQRKYMEGGAVKQEKGEKKYREYIAYKSAAEYPRDAGRDKIFVDVDREALLLPIHGQLVPFHITTVKSVTKTEDYLRIIFKTPGSGVTDVFKNPNATFIKELTFRVPRAAALNNAFRMINELKKRVTARESEKAIVESLTEQETLQRSATPGPRLANLNIRPTLGGGRRTLGTLEAHDNGFRFTTAKKGTVDIIYKNIKHAFFQPAENELIVLLHLRLHHAIMVGKKKTNDVQFFTEVMEASQALGSRGAWGDQDELEEEQREREMRTNLNAQFQQFVKRVEAFVRYCSRGLGGSPFSET
jgi:nucleosome binding factor SPN SPT16 subunit